MSHFQSLLVEPSTDTHRHWLRDRPLTLLHDTAGTAGAAGAFNMATDDPSSKISPWARGENLRHVEKEVLIPKIVREKAKAKCDDFVKGKPQLEVKIANNVV